MVVIDNVEDLKGFFKEKLIPHYKEAYSKETFDRTYLHDNKLEVGLCYTARYFFNVKIDGILSSSIYDRNAHRINFILDPCNSSLNELNIDAVKKLIFKRIEWMEDVISGEIELIMSDYFIPRSRRKKNTKKKDDYDSYENS